MTSPLSPTTVPSCPRLAGRILSVGCCAQGAVFAVRASSHLRGWETTIAGVQEAWLQGLLPLPSLQESWKLTGGFWKTTFFFGKAPTSMIVGKRGSFSGFIPTKKRKPGKSSRESSRLNMGLYVFFLVPLFGGFRGKPKDIHHFGGP